MEGRREPDPRQREMAYRMFNDEIGVATETMIGAHKRVEALVNTVYEHRMKLCARSGLDFEDADIEAIISAYEKLTRLCGERMYDQGWFDAGQVPGVSGA